MSQVMDDWMREIVNEAVSKAVSEAVNKAAIETTERKNLEYAQKLIRYGGISLEDIANLTTLSLEKVQTLANEINA